MAIDEQPMSGGTNAFSVDDASETSPITSLIGSVAVAATDVVDPIVVYLSEDAWNGDAQFTIDVDGATLAGPLSVTVAHGSGEFQDFTFANDLSAGPHTVAIHFVNDAWGGTPDTDRNLYVGGIDVNGVHYAGRCGLGICVGTERGARATLERGVLLDTGGQEQAPSAWARTAPVARVTSCARDRRRRGRNRSAGNSRRRLAAGTAPQGAAH